MEIIIIISGLLLILFIAYSFIITKQNHTQYNMVAMSEESIIKTSIKLVKTLRITTNGRGVTTNGLYSRISKCNKMLAKKNANNMVLNEAERWFFENYYLAFRGIFSQKNDLSGLPHCEGIPRLIILTRHIVGNSLSTLSIERVRKVFDNIKEHISLNYAEISNINFALNFAILEQIYILSNRLMFQEDCKKKAKKKKIDRNLLKYDSYCYYLFTLADLDMQQCDYLKKLGITFERVCLGHNQTIFDNAKMAQDLFGSLQRIEEFIPCKVGLEYIAPNNVFKTTPNYKLLSDNTLFAYCKIIEQISKKLNINEGYIAQKAKELAIENNMDISQIFYDYRKILIFYVKYGKIVQINKEKNYTKQRLYIASILSLTVISTIILFYFIGFYALLFSIPIIMFRIKLIDFLMAFNKKDKIVLSYNYSSVPSDAQTMVVICEYIDNLDQLSKSIRHAMIVKSNAKDDNIKVALLLDLKKSNSKTDAFDKEVSDYLRKYIFIEEINIFIRNRVKVGDKYQGYERKRGAIMSLNKMLITKNYDEFWYIQNKEELITPKFVVCMDADSMIMPDGISQMVNMFLHPYNDSKYDILSTINRYNLFSINNAYSKIFYKEGGIELYPNYAPFFYKRYGIGIFCGKGIYKLSSFYNKLEGIFPDNKILSHDILEGSILDCGVANVIFEDAPNSFLAENDRQSRWKKGDIQLLPFISGNWKNNKDEKINTKIDPLNKFLMVSNIINLTLPILIVITAVLGVLLQNKTLLITLGSMFVLPYLLDIVSIVRQIGNNVRIRHILADLLRCLRRLLLNIFMSLFDCVNNLGIIIKTLYNMIKGKNLLVWKPFFHIQSGKNTFVKYCALFCPSIVIGALLTIFSLLYSNIGIYLGAYVICSFIACVYLYILSQPQKKKELNNKDKEYLLSIAKKTYKYFEYMHIYDGMVADNLQIRPYKGDANKTSPTNIGFALLAEISAEKLGIISQDDCVENLIKILKSIKKLPKWYGNLYNWYDIEKKEPISKFVSSVDSGNFLCALLVTRAFFHQKKNYVGELTTQILINNTQINKLYDASKKLFYIGYDGDKFVSHYDLLNSESRLLSTIFVALYGQSEHLYSLKRDYSSLYGNTMMSWSGTAFEYLMPQLFINLPKYSGIEKTNKNVVKYQSKNLFLNLWGVSESGYAKLDSNQNYQYYAFGLKGLSLKNEENRGVISPYSSALALGYLDEKVVQNFRHLEWSNMLDEYGFFESYDTRNNSIIYSYMSHHQGMIICAICNNLGQNYLKDLFNFAPNVEGACQIYNEISSTVRFMPQTSKNTPNIINSDYKYYKNIDKIEYSNDTMALSDGKISLFTNLIGNTFIKYDNAIINKFVPIFEESSSGYFYVKNNKNEIYSPTYLPLKTEKNDYNYCYSNRSVLYENQAKKLSLDIALLPSLSGVVYRLKTNNQITKKVYFYMPITLCSTIDYLSHPAFYDLFVSAFVDDGILYITRKSRELNKKPLVMAVKLVGVKNIIWIANKAIFLGRNGKVEKPDYLYKDNKESSNLPYLGDILSPCVAFEAELKDNSNECQMLFIFGENYENVCEKVHSIDENMYLYAQNSHNNIVIDELTQSIMGDMLYSQYSKKTLQNIIKYNRTANFIQFCNSKKIIGYVFNEINIKELKTMIKVISDLTILRIEFNFVVFIEENEKNSNIDYINRILREDFVDNYQICKDEFYKEFCFILFDSNMSFTKNAYKINNFIEIEDKLVVDSVELSVNNTEITEEIEEESNNIYKSGNGYFDIKRKNYVINEFPTLLPYSNVIAGNFGGMVATENGGGYYYFENSRENKCIKFDNDYCQDKVNEMLAVKVDEGYLLTNSTLKNSNASTCIINKGLIRYKNQYKGDNYICDLYVILDGKARVIELEIKSYKQNLKQLFYTFYPCLDWCYKPEFITFNQENDIVTVKNLRNGKTLYLKFICDDVTRLSFSEETLYPSFEYCTKKLREKIMVVSSNDLMLLLSLNSNNIAIQKEITLKSWENPNNLELVSKEKAFNLIVNILPYQVLASRIIGKLGYYQVSGATGFRDQLQDCLSFFTRSELLKNQIIESIKHQYPQGDVMHWWHSPKLGLRTRISDDKLFLPYALCEYLDYSNDFAFLEQQYPYLDSDPLSPNEMSRFENPPYTQFTESVFQHSLRAIKNVLKYGEHNLLAMGSGDWNDGMDFVGSLGRGESVFVSMLCYLVINKFVKYCPESTKVDLLKIAEDLKENINKYAFAKDRYLRLFSDDGRWLGGASRESFQIDLLVQAFGVISGVADNDRGNQVLNTAKMLIDRNLGIIKLLMPPLDKNEYLGYISTYPKGIRENGGQYTHAAMWYLIALTMMNRQEEAFDLFCMINPIEKCSDKLKNTIYKGEPYVFSGDVYSNLDNLGRMGWSWYTGSASWAYKLVFEFFYGLNFRGNKLVITPKLPKKLLDSTINYTYNQSTYKILFKQGVTDKVIQDGEEKLDFTIELQDKKNSEIIVLVKI